MKKPRLPRKINLGGGYIIQIVLAAPTVLAEVAEDEHEPEMPYKGVWDWDARILYINKQLSMMDKWDVYWHELLHAVNDFKDYDRDFSI